MMDDDQDLRVALEASDRAAELALAHFEAGVSVTKKADGSPVTEADEAVERLLHNDILAARPDDAIFGEELGAVGSSPRRWIADPIDGTRSFSRRRPNWRVHLALEVEGTLQLGVVTAPAMGRQWWAVRGEGAFESPWPRRGEARSLQVSDTDAIEDATLDAFNAASRVQLPRSAAIVAAGELGWCDGLIGLLRGEVEGFLAECCQLWDHAPWIILVEEAGGSFTNRHGDNRGDQRGGLYSNAGVHRELLSAIGYPQPERS